MACGVIQFRPVIIRASINSVDNRKSEARNGAASPKWWSLIFGFISEPDYIDLDTKQIRPEARPRRSRFEPGSFTEEKARKLRRMTTDAASYHDLMYHSAIASRLASEISDTTAP